MKLKAELPPKSSWVGDAACKDHDPSLFDSQAGETPKQRAERELAAKAVCNSCVVKIQCGEHALIYGEPEGIWGGMTEAERKAIQRKLDL